MLAAAGPLAMAVIVGRWLGGRLGLGGGASLAALGAAGCRRRRLTAEERVRRLLAALEAAVEEGDVSAVRAALAPGFKGGEDLDRQQALALLQLRTRGARQVYLLARILDVDTRALPRARAQMLVAMAAVPIPSAEALPNLEADLHHFDVELHEDPEGPEGFLITRAGWKPARLDEML